MLKTRRRKGLGDQIAVSKYLDDEFVVSGGVAVSLDECLTAVAARVVGVGTCRLARMRGVVE